MPDFVPAQLLPGLQSYRGGLLQGQADPTQGLCQDTRGPAGGAGRSIIRGQLLGCPGILRARRLPSCGSITMKYAVRTDYRPEARRPLLFQLAWAHGKAVATRPRRRFPALTRRHLSACPADGRIPRYEGVVF